MPEILMSCRPTRRPLRQGLETTREFHRFAMMSFRPRIPRRVHPTLAISCEAVPPSILLAGAQGGTSACSTGAALSFVSCIALLGSSFALRVLPCRCWPGRVQPGNASRR
jgi:hypothetical protein